MNSSALLDLLGNENRRRILRLLAHKPCYVTEIGEYLGVSPKAVIDHLAKLEEAGLVESRVDDQRRKYFHIARNLRLEVNVSPYRFGTKSAYPTSVSYDVTACRYLSVDIDDGDRGADRDDGDGEADPTELAGKLNRLEDLEEELSIVQRWVQGRMTETIERLGEAVEAEAEAGFDGRLYADVLLSIQDGARTTGEIGEATGAPPELVEEALAVLADRDVVSRNAEGWTLELD